MAFALKLQDSLDRRLNRLEREFAAGESLRSILTKDLLTVEAASSIDLLTSILLLDDSGERLWHGAAPRLPQAYCDAIDGSKIGPSAGSCGTAAYLKRPVYVKDIASDPLWADYRHIALPHGLRACWSTPIFDEDRTLLGTFAIYHRVPTSPSASELEAIAMISGHVAAAIALSRTISAPSSRSSQGSRLRLVHDAFENRRASFDSIDQLRALRERLDRQAAALDRLAATRPSDQIGATLRSVAKDCRSLVNLLRHKAR